MAGFKTHFSAFRISNLAKAKGGFEIASSQNLMVAIGTTRTLANAIQKTAM
jgi:hypothetical protein